MFLRHYKKNPNDARDLYKGKEARKEAASVKKKLDVQKHISSFKKKWQKKNMAK